MISIIPDTVSNRWAAAAILSIIIITSLFAQSVDLQIENENIKTYPIRDLG